MKNYVNYAIILVSSKEENKTRPATIKTGKGGNMKKNDEMKAKKIVNSVGLLATDALYYKSRGVSSELLDGEKLANMYLRIKYWHGSEAARNFKEMIADIRVLSAYNVISALYMLEEKEWSYRFDLGEISEGREDYTSQRIRERFLIDVDPTSGLRQRKRRKLTEKEKENIIQETLKILGNKLKSSGVDTIRIEKILKKAEPSGSAFCSEFLSSDAQKTCLCFMPASC